MTNKKPSTKSANLTRNRAECPRWGKVAGITWLWACKVERDSVSLEKEKDLKKARRASENKLKGLRNTWKTRWGSSLKPGIMSLSIRVEIKWAMTPM